MPRNRQMTNLKRLDACVWSASNVQQKTLVVYWWASWCPFCAAQSPHIEALWRAWKDKGREGKVVFAEAGEMFPEDIEGLKKYI